MADIRVQFMHPTDGRLLNVTLDGGMTVREVIGELIANDFVPVDPQGYLLSIKGGRQILPEETLEDAGITDNTVLRVNPAIDAGRD